MPASNNNCDGFYCNDSSQLFESSSIACLSSPSSGELLNVPSSVENSEIHEASIPNDDLSEFTEDHRETEICFGMVSCNDRHISIGNY